MSLLRTLVIATAAAAGGSVLTGSPLPDAVAADGDCSRPYAPDSPWNTPVGADPVVDPHNDLRIARLPGPLTSDPTQYTFPVYSVNEATPRVAVALDGWLSAVAGGGANLVNQRAGTVELPLPVGAAAAAGYDRQIVLVDAASGDEWGASYLEQHEDGTFTAWNAYRYNTTWSGVPPRDATARPFFARRAGVPYLAGLVRRCEIERDRIDHALAFAYPTPRPDYIWPATKSDGGSTNNADLPEGARLQLDPSLTPLDLAAHGCAGTCLTITRALQEFGMILIDGSGRTKLMFEFEGTAAWDGLIDASTVSPVPIEFLRVIGDVPGPDPSPASEPVVAGSEQPLGVAPSSD